MAQPAPMLAALLAMALSLTMTRHSAGQYDAKPYDIAVRHLEKAVTPQRDGSHMPMLGALRQLHDPTLMPLFKALAQNDDPGIEVHSMLGMTELNPQRLSVDAILALQSSEARSVVIERGVSETLLDSAAMQKLLESNRLTPLEQMWLLARLVADKQTVDSARLHALSEDKDIDIAGLATWLLVELGDPSGVARYEQRLAELAPRVRNAHLREMFAAMRQYRFAGQVKWVARRLEEGDVDPEVVYDGLYALLSVDPAAALPLWQQHLGSNPTSSQSVRFALLLLSADKGVPLSEFDRLPTGEPLLDRLVALGRAKYGGGDVATALIQVIDVGHTLTARFAVEEARKLPPADATRVLTHVIRSVPGDRRGESERADRSLTATSTLFEINPEAVAALLAEAPDDSRLQEAMLIGLLSAKSPAAGTMAASVRRIGTSRADSLALILLAKHAEKLSDDDLRQLALVAAGGGKVSDTLQAQAAWLYIRHGGNADRALKQLLAAN
jgi:hypothetical protein